MSSRLFQMPRFLQVDPLYPNNGYPPRPNEDRPALSPFARLSMGNCYGKSSILIYNHDNDCVQDAGVDMINIEGDNLDAQQLIVTLHPPRVIPLSFGEATFRLDKQNLTGEQTNGEVTACDFPGEHKSIRWPPLEAIVEFGVGGGNTKFVVDYVNGVTFSVGASFLRVSALVTQSKKFGDIHGTDAAYYLNAHVAPGYCESRAQRTVFVGEVSDDDESDDVIEVPYMARRAVLFGTRAHHEHHPVKTSGFIRFWQSPDGKHSVGDYFFDEHTRSVEVPNAGQYFTIFNTSGHKMKMGVIFKLL
jgi:hypothetical protein